MNIVVLAGGLSYERDVSLSSGRKIVAALEEKGHRAFLLDLYIGAIETTFERAYEVQQDKSDNENYIVLKEEPNLEKLMQENENQIDIVGKNVIEICKSADFCFLALHGDSGENGKLQALLDIYGIRYSGSSYKVSMLPMDKDESKRLMLLNNIQTPNWIATDNNENIDFPVPCVVKTIDNGSSIGVEIVENKADLALALKEAKKYKSKIMIEEKIDGREFSVGLLGNHVLPAIEIIPKQGFYDYKNKYQEDATIEVTPADIPQELAKRLSDITIKVSKTLELSIYSRVDFIVTNDNKIYCIEANSLPGMTPTSLLPQEAAAVGISFSDLCEKIVELSLEN